MSPEEIYALYGKVVLMAGASVLHWQYSDMQKAVQLCKQLAIDTLIVKIADGAEVWHDQETYKSWRAYAISQGVGMAPFMYCYTRAQYGANQLTAQANIIRSFAEVNDNAGFVVDMETEFDGQVTEAQAFAALLHNLPGPLVVSSWANPKEHAFVGVIQAMESVGACAIGPQEYTNYLAAQEGQFPAGVVFLPEVDLTQEFGANTQVAIATQARNRGHNSLWLWSYEAAPGQKTLISQLVGIMKSETPPPVPVPAPVPAPVSGQYHGSFPTTHVVEYGDTLWGLAEYYYGDGSKYHTIYAANVGDIGANPDQISVGITLTIPAPN